MPPLVDAWVNFLNRWQWDWFCTLTFRDLVHPEAAAKRFLVFTAKINRNLYGSRWWKHGKGVSWARALERQRREAPHFHALLGGAGLSELRRLSWMDTWQDLAGFARIEQPRSLEAVQRYCTKYVVKGGEIDLGGPLNNLAVQPGIFAALNSPSNLDKIHEELSDLVRERDEDLRNGVHYGPESDAVAGTIGAWSEP